MKAFKTPQRCVHTSKEWGEAFLTLISTHIRPSRPLLLVLGSRPASVTLLLVVSMVSRQCPPARVDAAAWSWVWLLIFVSSKLLFVMHHL